MIQQLGMRGLIAETPKVAPIKLKLKPVSPQTDGAVDEEFLTLSPRLVGSEASSGIRRPSLVEGVGFDPASAPRSVPISLRRAGEHLMLRQAHAACAAGGLVEGAREGSAHLHHCL